MPVTQVSTPITSPSTTLPPTLAVTWQSRRSVGGGGVKHERARVPVVWWWVGEREGGGGVGPGSMALAARSRANAPGAPAAADGSVRQPGDVARSSSGSCCCCCAAARQVHPTRPHGGAQALTSRGLGVVPPMVVVLSSRVEGEPRRVSVILWWMVAPSGTSVTSRDAVACVPGRVSAVGFGW